MRVPAASLCLFTGLVLHAQERNVYFGDLHVHTSYSFDAYSFGNRNDPRAAYRYGRGEQVMLPGGIVSQLGQPLDFMAVTDHDIWMGELSLCQDPASAAYNTEPCRLIRNSEKDPSAGREVTRRFVQDLTHSPARHPGAICDPPIGIAGCAERSRTVWQEIRRIADQFYEPGKFTTLVGFEWSGTFGRYGMLHRNVIFRGAQVPDTIETAIDLNNSPERLWEWLEKSCTGDCQALAIPHNTNYGWGLALASTNSDGSPFTAQILNRRARTEPTIEIFQSKGNSECSPGLGTNDEQCAFEQLYQACKNGQKDFCATASDYVRNALKTGLTLEDRFGVNPFKYGFIGSTDTHSSAPGATAESTWHGVLARTDVTPSQRAADTLITFNPGGLAAVWADNNKREEIFDAIKRRETYATSGTRIRIRFFGGWNYARNLHERRDLVRKGYAAGVPMGGDLPGRTSSANAPVFVAWAANDSHSANLQRVQVIKGWAHGDETFERVYDIACSDGLQPDPRTHRCPDNGASVNQNDCSISPDQGAAELSATWRDPDFHAGDKAFYYIRVLENPTCRWSTYDALASNTKPSGKVPASIQERAWSSPIWYSPK